MADAQIKLAALWAALMLTYLLGDVLRIFSGDFKAGEIGGVRVTQAMWLGIAALMVIPIVMLVLTLVLPQPVNRWANIVVAVGFFLFNLAGLPGVRMLSGMAGLAEESGLSAPVLLAALGAWVVVPLAVAAAVFARREL